jgi:hypothetical protein
VWAWTHPKAGVNGLGKVEGNPDGAAHHGTEGAADNKVFAPAFHFQVGSDFSDGHGCGNANRMSDQNDQ